MVGVLLTFVGSLAWSFQPGNELLCLGGWALRLSLQVAAVVHGQLGEPVSTSPYVRMALNRNWAKRVLETKKLHWRLQHEVAVADQTLVSSGRTNPMDRPVALVVTVGLVPAALERAVKTM